MIDVPCEMEDVRRVTIQGAQISQVDEFSDEGSELLPIYARCLKQDHRPLACFGVMPVWRGVGQAWAVLSEEILKDHPICLSRSAKMWLEHVERREKLRRIQAAVAVGHTSGQHWIQWLGFRYEGLMLNYGLGGRGDFHLYARVN